MIVWTLQGEEVLASRPNGMSLLCRDAEFDWEQVRFLHGRAVRLPAAYTPRC